MDLVNKKVVHRAFGKGEVISQDDEYIEVDFEVGTKKFIYPDVFGKFLKPVDKDMTGVIEEKVAEQELRNEKFAIKRQREINQKVQDVAAQQNRPQGRKDHPKLQSVFWCKEDEIEDIFENWEIFVGRIKSGKREGEPRKLARMNGRSACLITQRESDKDEKERRILGAFMVDETFDGRSCEDGVIKANKDYRLRLTKEESDKMMFWNYYFNKRFPERMTWNSGRQRYFDNVWMAQILRDIVDMRKDPEEEAKKKKEDEARKKAEKESGKIALEDILLEEDEDKVFLDYFCRINRIDLEDLPEANGTLLREEEEEEDEDKDEKEKKK